MKPTQAPKPKRMMFVCTGNTCRSPMAAHLAREKLSRRGRPDIEVFSRGLTVASIGQDMNPAAKKTLAALGVGAEGHRAQMLTDYDVEEASVILTMTDAQMQEILRRHPQAKGKVHSLADYTRSGQGVADPYGGDEASYKAAATEISDALDSIVERIPSEPPVAKP
jgi:protein-tyrosine-phosphatase